MWTRKPKVLRHSEGYAVPRGIPHGGAWQQTVDVGGSPSPPSSSRSGDPPVRGSAVRRRYPYATNRGIPARSARMTAEFERQWPCRGRGSPKFSVIQRGTQYPVESPMEGQRSKPRTREGRPLLRHPREAGIPRSGAEQYVTVPPAQPTRGLRRRKVRLALLPPCGESFARSLRMTCRSLNAQRSSMTQPTQRLSSQAAGASDPRRGCRFGCGR